MATIRLSSGCELRSLVGHTSLVAQIVLFDHGQRLASVSDDQTLKIWDLGTGVCLATFYADGPLSTCAVAPDGQKFVTGGESGKVFFLNYESIKTNSPDLDNLSAPLARDP